MKKKAKPEGFILKPHYPGGNTALGEFIARNLRYPEAALAEKIEGTVVVRSDINHKGEVIRTQIKQGLGYGCDEEAERVVRLLKFEVGKNRGVVVTFHKILNINFRFPGATPKPNVQLKSQTLPPAPSYSEVVYHYTPSNSGTESNSTYYTLEIDPAKGGEG